MHKLILLTRNTEMQADFMPHYTKAIRTVAFLCTIQTTIYRSTHAQHVTGRHIYFRFKASKYNSFELLREASGLIVLS